MKRTVDLTLGTVLAIASIPAILCLAVVAAFSVGAWPFFVHHRIGRDGRLFRFVKLRTLPRNFPFYGLKNSVELLPQSRFMRFMRRRHLDELPQLFLVPLGRMSLVGPRPKMPDQHEPADAVYMSRRTQVRQGCTGLWQIGRHTHLLPGETPEYDYFYLHHAGLRLDLWIMWRTLLKMVGLGRPVGLDAIPRWAVDGRLVTAAETVPAEAPQVLVDAGSPAVSRAL